MQPNELPEIIEVSRHGLIVKDGYYQGLLLPQVAPENNFDEVELLDHTCLKAGLPPDAWRGVRRCIGLKARSSRRTCRVGM